MNPFTFRISDLPTYGPGNVSRIFRKEVKLRLLGLPEKFAPAAKHGRICAHLALLLCRRIKKKNNINSNFIAWAHLLRAAFKPFDSQKNHFIQTVKSDVELASEFALQYEETEISNMVKKYRKCHLPQTTQSLTKEDLIFLLTGVAVYGLRCKDGHYNHLLIHPRRRRNLTLANYPKEFHKAIIKEYNGFLIPAWQSMLMDVSSPKPPCATSIKYLISNVENNFSK